MTLTALPDASLLANEKVVLYSEGGIHASQAWMLLRAKGFKNVYTLKGGLDQWKEDVLFPTLAENATPQERARFERAAALARFFGGSPRTGGAQTASVKAPEMPKVEAARSRSRCDQRDARRRRRKAASPDHSVWPRVFRTNDPSWSGQTALRWLSWATTRGVDGRWRWNGLGLVREWP